MHRNNNGTCLTRKELYDLVWSKPIQRLAREFQISDVGLAKACRRHDIPRPPRGYWAKLASGKRTIERPKLPSTRTEDERIHISGLSVYPAGSSGDTVQVLQQYVSSVPDLTVPDELASPRPLVASTAKALRRFKKKSVIVTPPQGLKVLNLSVTPSARDRALRIADTLVKAFEQCGLPVELDPEKPASSVTVLGEKIEFLIQEQVNHEPHA